MQNDPWTVFGVMFEEHMAKQVLSALNPYTKYMLRKICKSHRRVFW